MDASTDDASMGPILLKGVWSERSCAMAVERVEEAGAGCLLLASSVPFVTFRRHIILAGRRAKDDENLWASVGVKSVGRGSSLRNGVLADAVFFPW